MTEVPGRIVYRPKPLWKRIALSRRLYLYVFPTLALLLTFSYYPALSALVHAFFDWDPFGGREFVGLANFREVYGQLFQPRQGLSAVAWAGVQWVAWVATACFVLFFILVERVREGGRRWLSVPAVALMGAGVLITLGSLLRGAGAVENIDGLTVHFVLGHGMLLALAAGQVTGWRKYLASGDVRWWRLLGAATAGCIVFGLGLLIRMTVGGDLRASVWNLARVMTFKLSVGLFMPLMIATALYHLRRERSKYIYRVLFVLPLVVPGIVNVLMWRFIYDYNHGVLNNLIQLVSQPTSQVVLFFMLWLLVTYIAVMSYLSAIRSSRNTRVSLAVLIALAAVPVALAAAYPVFGRGEGMGFAEFFATYGLEQVFTNAWLHAGLMTAVGLWLAVKLVRSLRLRLRLGESPVGAVFWLVLLAGAVGAIAWSYSGGSVVEHLSDYSGLGTLGNIELQPRNWLGSSQLALYSVMFMGFPFVGTIAMLIFYAGLQAIPVPVLESAEIDGVSGVQRFFSIEFPLILGQFKLLLILGIIAGIQDFQSVLILTYGGPGKATEMPGLLMFKEAFQYARLGYGTTIGAVMFLIILAITYVNMKYIRPSAEEEAQ